MKIVIFVFFGICLAALVLYLGTKQVTGNLDALLHDKTDYTTQSNQDLYKLKAYWENSEDQIHRDSLINQMCEIKSKMAGASAEIENFLSTKCN